MVLNFLGEEDRILSRSLGRKLQISSATMTGIIDRRQKLSLVERQPHPDDRRAILICLTDQGREYARKINLIMVQANKANLERIGPLRSQTLRETLKALSEKNP